MTEPAADAEPTDTGDAKPAKRSLKQRLTALFEEYGRIAVYTYFALSILTVIGFAIAFAVGAKPTSSTGFLGVLGAAWLAGKATILIRIPITIAITPGIAAIVTRLRRRKPPAEE